MGLKLGILKLDSKTHKKSSKGDNWSLIFKDEYGNTVKFKEAAESDFDEYDFGDYLEWGKVMRQGTLG